MGDIHIAIAHIAPGLIDGAASIFAQRGVIIVEGFNIGQGANDRRVIWAGAAQRGAAANRFAAGL